MNSAVPHAITSDAESAPSSIEPFLAPQLASLFWRADRVDAHSAWCGHIPFAHWLVGVTRPRIVVELGTHTGVSYAALCTSVERHTVPARCYAVDTWAGDEHAGKYGEEIFADLSQYHRARFSSFSTLIRSTFDEAVEHFDDGSVDLLHIDGLHSYDAVSHDFDTWKRKLSDRAVVLFHDTNERHHDFGVWKLWAELRTEFPAFEFIHGHGLGVLLVGKNPPADLLKIANLPEQQAATIRHRFSLLGERWEAEQQLLANAEHFQSLHQTFQAQLNDRQATHNSELAAGHENTITQLSTQLFDAEAKARSAERDLQRLRSQVEAESDAQAHSIAGLKEHISALEAALGFSEKERDAERTTRAVIEHSTFWRATQPVREFFARHPRVRRTFRGSARLVVSTLRGNLPRMLATRRAKLREAAIIENSELFDANWYITQYDDVRHSGLSAAVHYAIVGGSDHRNPSNRFDARWYVAQYPEVTTAQMNPLVHYELQGKREGLQIQPATTPQLMPAVAKATETATRQRPVPSVVFADELIADHFNNTRPLRVYPVPGEPRRITMVTDSISPGSLFGGVGTAIVFATSLAKRLGVKLRLVTRTEVADPTAFGTILKLNDIDWDDNIEFIFSPPKDGYAVPIGNDEIFVTTSWWTTRSVRQVCAPSQIVYLLQEDERMFYPFGDERLRCTETISDPDITVVVNSEILFNHLTSGPDALANVAANGTWFEPSFPFLPDVVNRRQPLPGEKRRFFFYARPNNLRNLYWRGLEVIVTSLKDGTLDPREWEFHFVGKDMPDAVLPHNIRPYFHQNLPWQNYVELISSMDIGLSLMDTPHPSYPPFDLAATGAIVVTNQHGCKTGLEKYSRNIICTKTDIESLQDGIKIALNLSREMEQRSANASQNSISKNWSQSFDKAFSSIASKTN
ncbi:class I SAM-dependent methyltransferase [Burkholderia sp. BCC1993]|uniref:rhamnosyltransferase WsaF family glycosyltransferase n=1 Tax=Burkholderia sp. BCC1993 TaxID=2817444 RepID=UPI002AB143C0|nr:class I SAM-dependent methyltransferase [Burkholderia sp. BCC1993]